jgi:hypothetical protein
MATATRVTHRQLKSWRPFGMARQAQVISVLIASPGDVPHLREALDTGIRIWNRGSFSKQLGVVLEVLRWEQNAVPMLGAGDAQQVINQQLASEADVVVAIFHSRLGTPTVRHPSGPAGEISIGVERGVPVHVYVDASFLPDGHDPAQYEALSAYLTDLGSSGLITTVVGQAELLERLRLALEFDVTELSNKAPPPTIIGPTDSLRDRLNHGADLVQTAEVYSTSASFDSGSEGAAQIFTRRRAELLELSRPLFAAAVEAVRTDEGAAFGLSVELIDALARNPYRGGITALLDLTHTRPRTRSWLDGARRCRDLEYASPAQRCSTGGRDRQIRRHGCRPGNPP